MSTTSTVLVVGSGSDDLLPRLKTWGVAVARAGVPEQLPGDLTPSLVVVSAPVEEAGLWVRALRANPRLKGLPVVAAAARAEPGLEALDVDAVAVGDLQLERQILAGLRAREALEAQAAQRVRLEAYVHFRDALPHAKDEREQLQVAARAVAEVVKGQVGLLHLGAGGAAVLIDSAQRSQPVELSAEPLLRQAIDSGRVTEADGTVVFPVTAPDGPVGALVVKDAPLPMAERAFIAGVIEGLTLQLSSTRAIAALHQERADLEHAYLDRYRELSQTNKRLEKLDQWKDEMLAMVSHDARAPLQVLLGHGRLLLEDDLPHEVRPGVDAMVRMGKKILDMMESVLDRARTTRGAPVFEPQPVDLAKLCRDTIDDLSILGDEQRVRLKVDAPQTLEVNGDLVKLRQVLENLVVNALHHAKGAKQITLRCAAQATPEGRRAKVCVEDDGAGFSAAEMSELFDRYERQGIGKGLSICRELVRLHGGEIWAEQRQPKGAVLAFTLPLKADEAKKPKGRAPVLLLADDDPNIRKSFSRILGRHWTVVTAVDGVEAVSLAREIHPDVALIDLFMPRRDGLDTVRELRKASETRDLPVLLMSARAEASERTQGEELEGIELVPKLTPPEELVRRVRALIESAQPQEAGAEPVPGLLDRGGLTQRLEEERARAQRYGRPLSLVLLRPQGVVGSQAHELATFARLQLRSPDLIAHLGQGVLVLVLPETQLEAAHALANRLCAQLEAKGAAYSHRVAPLQAEVGAAESLELLLS